MALDCEGGEAVQTVSTALCVKSTTCWDSAWVTKTYQKRGRLTDLRHASRVALCVKRPADPSTLISAQLGPWSHGLGPGFFCKSVSTIFTVYLTFLTVHTVEPQPKGKGDCASVVATARFWTHAVSKILNCIIIHNLPWNITVPYFLLFFLMVSPSIPFLSYKMLAKGADAHVCFQKSNPTRCFTSAALLASLI